jgi:uncharacterized heparinase superfamily protein
MAAGGTRRLSCTAELTLLSCFPLITQISLTAWVGVRLEELIVSELKKKFCVFYRTRSFVVIFTEDQPRGLVVRASDYLSRGPGFDSRLNHGNFPCRGRIPVVTMVWVVSRSRLKVGTSSTRSQKSINSD